MVQKVPQKQRPGIDLDRIYEKIDQENAQDPTLDPDTGLPAALLYGRRMTECLEEFHPQASTELKVAIRAQHIRRFDVPRQSFPEGRPGYLAWRSHLLNYQAATLQNLLCTLELGEAFTERAVALVKKENIREGEGQVLEDVACLVFLKHYMAEFARTEPEDRLLQILRKTARRMSAAGRQAALSLSLPEEGSDLLRRALA